MLQAIAAGWHSKSDEQLGRIGKEVGKGRILVLHGDRDGMIPARPHVDDLARGLAGGQFKDEEGEEDGDGGGEEVRSVVWEGAGHVLTVEKTDEVNQLITELVQKNK